MLAERAACVCLAAALSACSAGTPSRGAIPASAPGGGPLQLAGLAVATEGDWVVRVVAEGRHCTGALVHEGVVLTAHHCVVQRGAAGEYLPRDLPPSALRVELGGDDLPWGEVGVRAVVAPPCGHAAGVGDIALLVLDRRLVGLTPADVRLDREPVEGEGLEPVGFGVCASPDDGGGIRRHRRAGGVVQGVYAMRFRMTAAICPGDSGGPVVSRPTREVVGVISASVQDSRSPARGTTELTRVDAWAPLFAVALPMAEGVPAAELPPVEHCPPG